MPELVTELRTAKDLEVTASSRNLPWSGWNAGTLASPSYANSATG